jgi:hypothetical protein
MLSEDPHAAKLTKTIVDAGLMALRASQSALWTAIIPCALRPFVFPVLKVFPTYQLRRLYEGRSKLYGLAMTLAKNAMERLNQEWVDEIGMEKAFGEQRARGRAGAAFAFVCRLVSFGS